MADPSPQYDWDRYNKGHIAAHHVEPRLISDRHGVEEVLANEPVYIETRIDAQNGEERILDLGHTNAGRVLFVAWTPRGEFRRPVTAFEANRKTSAAYQKRRYEEKQQ
jgi:uncharacterized DUF497 family protein